MASHDASQAPGHALIAALSSPAAYGAGVASVRVVETHISWVFLTGELAYKVKKPIRLPFLDFSTLEARQHFCNEELRLNRRLAPEIYLEVVPIGGSAAEPRIGALPAIEYAVKMVEFPASARLDRVIAEGALRDGDMLTFAERLAAFHRDLVPAPANAQYGGAAAVRRVATENLEQARDAGAFGAETPDALGAWLDEEGARLDALFDARRRAGEIREGHGDLHLENLIDWHGEIVAFDALEFDPALRWVDTIDEVAFLTMDLHAHARVDLGFRFLNRYLEVDGDYAALALLRYYMVHRALVRAKVRALGAGSQPSAAANAARPYAELAQALSEPPQPTLVITHGFSGSGKTTWTSELLAALPAIRLRSDVARKRQAGLGELDVSHSPVGGGLYSESRNDRAYAGLATSAGELLEAGYNVLVDATFLRRADRKRFAELAASADARFRILDFDAAAAVLRDRITARNARSKDASEATLDVLEWQLAHADALDANERARTIRIDTEAESPSDIDAALVTRVLGRERTQPRSGDGRRA